MKIATFSRDPITGTKFIAGGYIRNGNKVIFLMREQRDSYDTSILVDVSPEDELSMSFTNADL